MTTATPASEIELFSDENLAEPYESYRELRDLGPIVYLERYDLWAISRYAGVREVLSDWKGFTSREGVALNDTMNAASVGTLIGTDPPEHTKLRKAASERLSPGAMARMSDQIFAQADDLVVSLVRQGEFDVVRDLAVVFPVSVVADLIGLPAKGRENLFHWGEAIFNGFGPDSPRTTAALPHMADMFDYIATVATRERLTPGSMGMAVYEAADRGDIEPEACISLLGGYVSAGMDTTINAIGTMVLLLTSHAEQFQVLKRDPSLIRSAVNEILRIDSPVQAFTRVTTGEQSVEGRPVSAEKRVLVIYGSANRDERKWDRPDEFDVARNPVDHMGFGHGVHRCVGSSLARLEIEAVLTSLVNRVRSIDLAGPYERRINNTARGLRSMPVSIAAETERRPASS